MDLKYLGSFEMRCARRMEKISWKDRVKNEDVCILYGVKVEEVSCIKWKEGRLTGLVRSCVGIGGTGEVVGRRGGSCKQLLHDLKEREDTAYWERTQ